MRFALYTFFMDKTYNAEVNKELGARIKKIREKQGKSQDVVADMMGFDRSYWSKIELGKKGMTVAFLLRVANVLDVKIEDIVQGMKESDFES